jgi:hypothetical protein
MREIALTVTGQADAPPRAFTARELIGCVI